MRIEVKHGDVLAHSADVLICSANPQLNLSGGVGGEILRRGGVDVQRQLHEHLREIGQRHVAQGQVVRSDPGPVSAQYILHAVAVDAFYDSSVETVSDLVRRALGHVAELNATSVVMPALATGYGPLTIEQFAEAVAQAVEHPPAQIESLTIVLRREEDARTVRDRLSTDDGGERSIRQPR